MGPRADYVLRRAKQRIAQRGCLITYRRMVKLDEGMEPKPNPAEVEGLVVDTDQSAGATTLLLRGLHINGSVVAGDRLTIGFQTLAAGASASDDGDNTLAVPLSNPLLANVTDGTAVTMRWINDRRIHAMVNAMRKTTSQNTLVENGDLDITIAALSLPFEPSNSDRIVLDNGDSYEIIAQTDQLVDGIAAEYRLQAR